MSNPWDGMSKDKLSETELRKLRYQMQFFEQNDQVIRRAVLIFKAWWLLPVGVVLAASGSLGRLIEIVTNKAGL